jgi:hypothetical protein
MGALAIKLLPEAVRSIASGSIGVGYMGVGTPLANPSRLIMFQNYTDAALMVSFDGITDHLPVAASGFALLDVTANKTVSQGFYIAEGTRFYVKEIGAPTTGSFYISTFYGVDV